MKLIVVFVALSLNAVSCGDSDDDDTAVATGYGRCELTGPFSTSSDKSYSMCHDFKNWPTSNLTQAETDCSSSSELGGAGTYSTQTETGGCSLVGHLGSCSWSSGSLTISTVYSSSTATASDVESLCASTWSGTWTAASLR